MHVVVCTSVRSNNASISALVTRGATAFSANSCSVTAFDMTFTNNLRIKTHHPKVMGMGIKL